MREFLDLAERWQRQASDPWVAEEVRAAFICCAADLREAIHDMDNALLSPNEAAKETGLAPSTIRKRLSEGKYPNEGTPYRPKVRRRALREAISETAARKLTVVR